MPTLHITRGLPGSGKSTWAQAWVAEDPRGRARVNRDDLRAMVDNGRFLAGVTEWRILAVRDAAILTLLSAGVDVVCDDTNLPQKVARELAALAARAGARLEVHDFTGVPLQECIRRDAARPRPVGEAVIREKHDQFLRGRLPLPPPVADPPPAALDGLYEPKPGTPRAVLVDVDGTVADANGRNPYDETHVHEDLPNAPVIAMVRAMAAAGHSVIFMSGRSEGCRHATEAWLTAHVRVGYELHMRAIGDRRKDAVVKRQLFDEHVRDRYHVVAVFDDRQQVVDMWRGLGLTVAQVAEGNF